MCLERRPRDVDLDGGLVEVVHRLSDVSVLQRGGVSITHIVELQLEEWLSRHKGDNDVMSKNNAQIHDILFAMIAIEC